MNDPLTTVLDALRAAGCDPKGSGGRYSCRCPAHDDRNPSFSVAAGDDGRALVHCHVGCAPEAIVAALGLTLADLMPPFQDGRAPQRNGGTARPSPTEDAKSVTSYPTARAAVEALEMRHGHRTNCWTYTDAEGAAVAMVVRWDLAEGGKRILPVSRDGEVWRVKGVPEPRPLYRLPHLAGAGTVWVHEGEKAADYGVSIELNSTTSMHGANSPGKTDWSALAGSTVVISRDNDDDGEKYAQAVLSSLLTLDPPARVKVITLPGLPPKGDIVEFVEGRREGGATDEDIRAEIEAIAKATPWASVSSGSTPPGGLDESWPLPEPLPDSMPPVDSFDPNLLPERFRAWAVDIAERTQCPIDYVAVSMMVALSSVVGRSLGIRPKRLDNWTVVPNLWGAVIGRPGMMKTPALQEALKPLRQLDLEAKRDYDQLANEIAAMEEVAKAKQKHKQEKIRNAVKNDEDALRLAMESIDDEDQTEPTRRRFIINDSSVEKLGEILNENPRGVLVYRDELIGLLKSLDKEGQESARSFYLEAWNGSGSFIYDRIGRGTIDIEAAIVSILGGIQPGPLQHYLRAVVKGGAGDDGLMQRFQLLVWPDTPSAWVNVDRTPDSEARRAVFDVFAGLDRLDADIVGADHDPMEADGIPFLRFDDEAQQIFDEWREELEPRLRSGDIPAVLECHLSKFRSLVPSQALLCHLADGGRGPIGAAHLLKALAWADYLESHAHRVYASAMNPDVVAARALGKRILSGSVQDGFGLRSVYRNGWASLASAEDVKDAARMLVELDWLREERVQTDGRPGVIYRINPRIPGLKTPDTPPEVTDRTDGTPTITPSVGSVSSDQGDPANPDGDEEVA